MVPSPPERFNPERTPPARTSHFFLVFCVGPSDSEGMSRLASSCSRRFGESTTCFRRVHRPVAVLASPRGPDGASWDASRRFEASRCCQGAASAAPSVASDLIERRAVGEASGRIEGRCRSCLVSSCSRRFGESTTCFRRVHRPVAVLASPRGPDGASWDASRRFEASRCCQGAASAASSVASESRATNGVSLLLLLRRSGAAP